MTTETVMDDEGVCHCGCNERCAVVAELRSEIERYKGAIRQRNEEEATIQAAHAREVGELGKGITRRPDDVIAPNALWNEVNAASLEWKGIAEALQSEVMLLKQANIAYSSDNANLLGRALAAEKKAEASSSVEFIIETINCGCHPETCCCADYRLRMNGDSISTGSHDGLTQIKNKITAAMSPRVEVIK